MTIRQRTQLKLLGLLLACAIDDAASLSDGLLQFSLRGEVLDLLRMPNSPSPDEKDRKLVRGRQSEEKRLENLLVRFIECMSTDIATTRARRAGEERSTHVSGRPPRLWGRGGDTKCQGLA